MQTFSGRVFPKLDGVIFAVEGDPKARRVAHAITRSLGGVPVAIRGRDKPVYHATAVLVCGSGFPLIESALQMLVRIGFTRRRAMQTLLPLTRQMLDNVERIGPRAAWTGPLSRGDYAVVAKHVKALRSYPREVQQAYAALALLAGRVLSKQPGARWQTHQARAQKFQWRLHVESTVQRSCTFPSSTRRSLTACAWLHRRTARRPSSPSASIIKSVFVSSLADAAGSRTFSST